MAQIKRQNVNSVVGIVTGLRCGSGIAVRFPAGTKDFFVTQNSQPALRLTQRANQWVKADFPKG